MKIALMVMNILTAVAVGISAFCWFKSAYSEVIYDPNAPPDESGLYPYTVVIDDVDHHATLKLQTFWNKYAAISASAAATSQFVATALSFFSE